MVRPLQELIAGFELSTYRENVFEQVFCAELLQAAWIQGLPALEIDRPFVDFAGYDLIITCGRVSRHAQLKATAGQIKVHRALGEKPSGCVINLRPTVGGDPARLGFRYELFAAAPGLPLDLAGLPAARKAYNTRQTDGSFSKAERMQHVVVSASRFPGSSQWTGF
jgi:hypothetical protein